MVNKMCNIYREKKVKKKMKCFKSNGHVTIGGLFNQRSYDRWKVGPDSRGREGEPGRGGGGGGPCGLGPWAGPWAFKFF